MKRFTFIIIVVFTFFLCKNEKSTEKEVKIQYASFGNKITEKEITYAVESDTVLIIK